MSCGSFADWMGHVYWVGGVRQIPSLCGVGGETGYIAQEDLKSVNSYDMGEGRTICVWFFRSCIPRPSLVLSFLSSLGHHVPLFLGPIPWPLLIPRSCLPISFLRHWGTQSQRKRGDDHSGFRLYRGIVGLWVPFACSLSGCIYRGR